MSHWSDIPLIVAAHDGDISLVSRLLSEGHNINIKERSGYTPLIYASCNGHERVVSLLIERSRYLYQE